jgi:hypothetical protein
LPAVETVLRFCATNNESYPKLPALCLCSICVAPQAPGARRARLHRLVRLPLPPLQGNNARSLCTSDFSSPIGLIFLTCTFLVIAGKQERAGHRHRVLEEEDRWNRVINLSEFSGTFWVVVSVYPAM